MASFDFFTQARGPNIDIDLFPRSRQIGAQTGNLIKTPLQAGIEGALSGIENGFDLTAKYQQNEIRQNQIEQQPVENQIRQNQARIGAAQADIAQTEAYINNETEQEQLDAQKAALQQKADDIKYRKEITQTLSNPDPKARAAVFNNPAYTDIFSRDTKLFEYAIGSARQGLRPDQFDALSSSANLFKERDYEVQKDRQNALYRNALLKERQKATEDFQNSPDFSYATQGIDPSDIGSRIEVYPTGVKSVNPSTKKIDRNAPDKIGESRQLVPGDKEYTIYRDGEPIKQIPASEAGKYFRYNNIETNLNDLGKKDIFGAPSPMERARTKVAATKAEATAGTDQATQERLNSFSTQEDSQTNTNGTIVEQKRQQFNQLAKSPPTGYQGSTLENRLIQKKSAIRSQFTGKQDPRAVSQESYDLLSYLGGITPTNKPVLNAPKFDNSTPDRALSSVAKTPVSFKASTNFTVSPETRDRVQTNQYLQNQSPLTKGLATVESGGKFDAVSSTGVEGLLQVTKRTAAQYGLNRDIPEENVLAGQLYLNDLYHKSAKDIRLALAGYNAGPSNIALAVDRAGTTEWSAVRIQLKGILSAAKYEEVKDYPDKVLTAATQFMGQNESDDQYFYGMLQVSGLVEPV